MRHSLVTLGRTLCSARMFILKAGQVIYVLIDDNPKVTSQVVEFDLILRVNAICLRLALEVRTTIHSDVKKIEIINSR